MEDKSVWALLFTGIGVVGIAAWFTEEKAPAGPNRAPAPPTTRIGTGTVLQTRPMPTWSSMGADGQSSYVQTMQQELTAIGYGDLPVNGDPTDPATVAAFNRFAGANADGLHAYGYGLGGGTDVDMAAKINAIDDIARGNTGAEPASDYRAPATTAGLSGALPMQKTGAPTSREFAQDTALTTVQYGAFNIASDDPALAFCTPYVSTLRNAQAALDAPIPSALAWQGADGQKVWPGNPVFIVPRPLMWPQREPWFTFAGWLRFSQADKAGELETWLRSAFVGTGQATGIDWDFVGNWFATVAVPRIDARAHALQSARDAAQHALDACLAQAGATHVASDKARVVAGVPMRAVVIHRSSALPRRRVLVAPSGMGGCGS